MEFVAMTALLAMVKNLVDLARRATGGDPKGAATILLSYLVGVVVVLLFANSDFAQGLAFGDLTLSDAGVWSQVIIGIAIAGSAGVATDVLKAVDNRRSTVVPNLFEPKG